MADQLPTIEKNSAGNEAEPILTEPAEVQAEQAQAPQEPAEAHGDQASLHEEQTHAVEDKAKPKDELAIVSRDRSSTPGNQESPLEMALDLMGFQPGDAFLERCLRYAINGIVQGTLPIQTISLYKPYRPSKVPFTSLKEVQLHELKLETSHRGRVLIVRARGPPAGKIGISSRVEDASGSVQNLVIYNVPEKTVREEMLASGAVVAVKEPYYRIIESGQTAVRVDHPSDIMVLRLGNWTQPGGFKRLEARSGPSAKQLMEDGHAAFGVQDMAIAVDYYSAALDALRLEEGGGSGSSSSSSSSDVMRRELHLSRATAHLVLDHFEDAIADGLAALIPAEEDDSPAAKDHNCKIYYRLGRAAYDLEDYVQARDYFQAAYDLDPDAGGRDANLRRTLCRVKEQAFGDYDFAALLDSTTKNQPRLDHASWTENTKVASAGLCGRGLFATKAFNAGELIFVEKAFFSDSPMSEEELATVLRDNTVVESPEAQARRYEGLLAKMQHNPTLANKYFDLHDGGGFEDAKKTIEVVDGQAAVDAFRARRIAERNSFAGPRGRMGIWLQASYMNHSCVPNVGRAYAGDMMIVSAARPIEAGEELLTTYTMPMQPFAQRTAGLERNYGFTCRCPVCQAEEQVSEDVATRRGRLRAEVADFLAVYGIDGSKGPHAVPAADMKNGLQLLAALRGTYPESLFAHLPRLDCVHLALWAGLVADRPDTALYRYMDALRDLGVFVTIHGRHVNADLSHAVLVAETVLATRVTAEICAMSKKSRKAAKQLYGLAKTCHVAHFGGEKDWIQPGSFA